MRTRGPGHDESYCLLPWTAASHESMEAFSAKTSLLTSSTDETINLIVPRTTKKTEKNKNNRKG